jgi:hypothetical protein
MSFMLSDTNKYIMLSVVMLNVIIINVVAPLATSIFLLCILNLSEKLEVFKIKNLFVETSVSSSKYWIDILLIQMVQMGSALFFK